MEMKWFVIGWAVIMVAIVGSEAIEKYQVNQCRLAYAQSTKTGVEISQICK